MTAVVLILPPMDDVNAAAMMDPLRCDCCCCCWTKEWNISNGLFDDVEGAEEDDDDGAAAGVAAVAEEAPNGSNRLNGLLFDMGNL